MASTNRSTSRPFAAARPARSLFTAPVAMAPPSERVVSAVMALGDVWEERQDGFTTIRLSPAGLERVAAELGFDAMERSRALDVSIVYDESEAQIVRVMDLGPLRAGRDEADQANRYAAARQRSLRPVHRSYPAAA